jgi:DNA-binding HxlR family transcriptional regulator
MPEEAAHQEEAAGGLLAVLADDWTWLVMCELPGPAAEPERQEQLQERLPPFAVSTVNERLHRLLAAGIATERRLSERPPSVAYQLTRQGAEARPVREAAARWESRALPAGAERSLVAGGTALELLADEWVLPIMGCLATGTRRPGEISEWLPELPAATLEARLRRMRDFGVLRRRRQRGFPVRVEYQLSPSGRSLAGIVLLAVRWEWRWGRPARPLLASNLAGLLRLIAPLVRIDPAVSGVCELTVLSAIAIEPSATLGVHDGTIAILAHDEPRRAPDARAQAQPLAWCDALISGRRRGLDVSGSAELVREILKALHGALAVDWTSPPA